MAKNGRKLTLGDLTISSNLTIKDIRRAKRDHGLSFDQTGEQSPVVRIQTDPLSLIDATFALYEPRLNQKNIDNIEQLEELLDAEAVEGLRKTLVEELAGFFPLMKMLYTRIQEIQSGDLSALEKVTNASPSTMTS